MAVSVCIIRNPVSGRGAGLRRWRIVEATLADLAQPVEIISTSGPGVASKLAAEAVARGASVVVAAGGDGTLNEVLNGVADTDCALGVIPLGTGNDFVRSIGATDVRYAVCAAVAGEARPIDIGRWSCQGRSGYFLNIAGCGFDGTVARRVNEGFRRLRGTAAYVAAVLHSLAAFRAVQASIAVDGQEERCSLVLCAVANASCYGGGMRVAPEAKLDDGLFDIVTVRDISKTRFLAAFPRVYRGTHLAHPQVGFRRGRHISIRTDAPLPILADGEVVGDSPVDFQLLPGALRFMMPR